MRAIFVSYRREDSEGEAGRLFDDLVAVFGEDAVFMDVAAIQVGRDFRKAIDDSVATCGVLLAVIGKNWLDAKNAGGQRRLDDPSDFVRLETASALKRDIPVVPVLVRGSAMPRPEELPDDLKELSFRNGVELTHPRWNSDLQLLINALRPLVGDPKHAPATVDQEATKPEPKAARQADPQVKRVADVPVPPKKSMGKIIAVAAAVVVIAIILLLAMMSPKQVAVPDVSGDTLAEATSKLAANHLAVGTKTRREDASQDPNTVLSQSPAANSSVKPGTAIDLVLAQGSELQVPPLVGESLEDARQTLAERQLRVGSIERKPKAGVARGTVLQEFPVAGEKVKSGATVDLMVAGAPEAAAEEPSTKAAERTQETAQRKESDLIQGSATESEAAAPPERAKTAEPVVNVAGYWHDSNGVTYQLAQRGNNFTYSASGAGGVSRGGGVIQGLQFQSTYNAAYTNGSRSTGRCAGAISADGTVVRVNCVDSVLGQTSNILSR